ncbi:PTS transporter subunit EIIC [Mesoplasma photuris]|uniref:PTS transporter subunit EIIC n=1 Tax=Mesoplasma photuris TaxID=217731 RepID=UPI0004E0BEE1|nr:PTS transporter subunit EIIC [Mesoplasma photuris]
MNLFKKTKSNHSEKIYDLDIKDFKSKYRSTAEAIYEYLGKDNYSKPYNCMTRFRTNIKNKNIVNIEKIKQIPLVKGINWNGPELQIIIGGEVPKVLDEFIIYEKIDKTDTIKNKSEIINKKPSIGKRFMAGVVGIIQPAIGLIIAGGMLVAIYALLTLEGGPLNNSIEIINNFGEKEVISISMQTLYLFGVWDSLFFILANTIMPAIGIFFIYNTARYFDANPWFAIAVGLFLLSQGFFPLVLKDKYTIPENISNVNFGEWISDSQSEKNGFFLFAIGDFPIVIMGYQGSIIPYIVGGLLVVFIDKWIKKWMPAALDITFRGLLVILSTMLLLWFILAPISSLLEFGIFKAMTWIGTIPYGFGTAIFTALWQPLVIIGTHTPLGVMIDTNISSGTPQLLGTANVSAYWGQLGAVLAVAITTKNMSLKKMAFATIPAGVFGITEPIIYGINLPRTKPFIYGCLGALVGGFLIGILDIDMDIMGTFGILSALRFNDYAQSIDPNFQHAITYSSATEVGLLFMVWFVTFSVGFGITFLAYKERKNEAREFKKSIKLLTKWAHLEKEFIINIFNSELSEIGSMKKDYKNVYKYYGDMSKIQNKELMLEEKENTKRNEMYKKLVSLKRKLTKKEDSELFNKFNDLNNLYEKFSLYDERNSLDKKKKDLENENKFILENFENKRIDLYQKANEKIDKQPITNEQKEILDNIIWNGLYSVEISFDLENAKKTSLKNRK